MGLIKYDNFLDNFNSKLTPTSDISVLEDTKKIIRQGHNIDYPSYQGYYQNFDRYYSIYNDLELDHLIQYVFIVRPDLNIVNSATPTSLVSTCENDAYLKYMCSSHNILLRCLTSTLTAEHDFIPFLVGRTEGIQMPDISIKNYSISQPFTNILMPYAGNMWESLTGGTFDITFREDREFRIHKFFQTWLYYMDGVTRNAFKPKDIYIKENRYDYMCSVYYMICQADGESLVWWNKYTGALPTSVPNSDMSFNLHGAVETRTTIPFAYFMQDIPMNPYILIDFNRNSAGEANYDSVNVSKDYISGYDNEVLGTRNGMFGSPFVSGLSSFTSNNARLTTLAAGTPKLRWRAPKTF